MQPFDNFVAAVLGVIVSGAIALLLWPVFLIARSALRQRMPKTALVTWSLVDLLVVAFCVLALLNGYLWFIGNAGAWGPRAVWSLTTAITLLLLVLLMCPVRVARWSLAAVVIVGGGGAALAANRDCLNGGIYEEEPQFFMFGSDERASPDGEYKMWIFQEGCDADAHEQGLAPVSVFIDSNALFKRGHEVFRVEQGLTVRHIDGWWDDERHLVIQFPESLSPRITVQETYWNGVWIAYE